LNVDRSRQRIDNAAQNDGVLTPAERGIQVDEVQPLGALFNKRFRRLERVTERFFGSGIPLRQTNCLTVGNIDGR
jgi:hypothetical protein